MRYRAFTLGALLLLQPGCAPVRDLQGASGAPAQVGIPALHGRIERFEPPAARQRLQAVIGDIASGATVSLIEPDSGRTVSSAVSSGDGTFSLSFATSFVPAPGKPYFLEAVKGLPVGGESNRAGAAIARVRTLMAFQGGVWGSLTGSGVVISRATTALAVVASHRGLNEPELLALVRQGLGHQLRPWRDQRPGHQLRPWRDQRPGRGLRTGLPARVRRARRGPPRAAPSNRTRPTRGREATPRPSPATRTERCTSPRTTSTGSTRSRTERSPRGSGTARAGIGTERARRPSSATRTGWFLAATATSTRLTTAPTT